MEEFKYKEVQIDFIFGLKLPTNMENKGWVNKCALNRLIDNTKNVEAIRWICVTE